MYHDVGASKLPNLRTLPSTTVPRIHQWPDCARLNLPLVPQRGCLNLWNLRAAALARIRSLEHHLDIKALVRMNDLIAPQTLPLLRQLSIRVPPMWRCRR
jgi:hypothetical protein